MATSSSSATTEPKRSPGEWYAIAAIVAVSVVAHLWRLGWRPLAHDEAIDANFAWQARDGAVMRYDPVYHGPLRFYLEGLLLRMFGTGAASARLLAALCGIAATAAIATARSVLGKFGAPIAAALFVVSPSVLTITRTGREDSLVGLLSIGVLLIVADALRVGGPSVRHVVGASALLALSFGVKETTFIFGFAGACFFAGAGVVAWRRDGGARRFLRSVGDAGMAPWWWALATFFLIVMVIYTSGFRYAAGFESGLLDGIRYWLSQHEVGRGSQRWFFYLTILGAYEWLALALAAIGGVRAARHHDLVGGWFVTMAVIQLAIYSWAGEKFAWLMLHPMLPIVLLAGIGGQHLIDRTATGAARRATAVALAVALLGTGALAIRPAITDGDDPRELLVTVQTQAAVRDLAAEIRAGYARGDITSVLVDERDSGSWPWAWYLVGLDRVEYVTVDPAAPLPAGYDVYIVSASTDPPPIPAGYRIDRFALRGWWLPDWDRASLADVARWLFTREVWNPIGTSDQFVIRPG